MKYSVYYKNYHDQMKIKTLKAVSHLDAEQRLPTKLPKHITRLGVTVVATQALRRNPH